MGLPTELLKVLGSTVGDGHCGIGSLFFLHEKSSKGFSHNVTAANDDNMFARGVDLAFFKEGYDPEGSAGGKASRDAEKEFADVDGVKPIDIFIGVNRFDNRSGVNLFGEGLLN
ncbi:hypothetical protein NEPTK9_000670 [Candidatus Neptunochlamydia vexilliferae]|uniref:Uncharacterized protein n=1 Tax=Candidatus Neptunichlamydia vexilliferae TaxID=1651774 RepID=A0ABS0AYE6_9BACT|nr:hypothetical protein [Candidatus Neptunochlamydia vexilliferae]